MKPLSAGTLVAMACQLEVVARKPGNVHRFADFDDSHLLDFLLSASAIAGPMDRASEAGIGRTILDSVIATRRVVATNTNLGMILLLSPLAAVPAEEPLRAGLSRLLETTTIDDARFAYGAIRLAQPGGLGTADEQDVAAEPTISLVEAMRLASDRDLIARQYTNGFAEVFDDAVEPLRLALTNGHSIESAILFAQLHSMARHPDSLIARKLGREEAAESSRRAASLLDGGWPVAEGSDEKLAEFDAWLRQGGHARNPGTTADLLAAALFIALREGTITLPLPSRAWSSSP